MQRLSLQCAGLLAQAHQLADRAGEVADGGGEGELGVRGEVVAAVLGVQAHLAQEAVDGLVGRPRVEPHREHLILGQEVSIPRW